MATTPFTTNLQKSSSRNFTDTLKQFIRFGFVGGMNTLIDIVAFNMLVWMFPTNNTYMLVVYNSLAYAIGAINSFFWNKVWTFRQHRSKVTQEQLLSFILVTSLGIICNDMLLWLVTSLLNSFSITGFLWINLAKICAIAGTVAISYFGMRFSVFKPREEDREIPAPQHPYLFRVPSSLSIILPAYNEEALIESTITHVMQVLITWMQDFEVIVVNDGSKDRTGEIVARLASYDRRIRLINHPVNKGYGAALVTGFEAFTKDFVFFMDSDGQFDIQDLARFFPLIEEYDVVLGYRIHRQDTFMRKLNAWGWKLLVSFIFDVHVRDIDCAFKLYRADFFRTHRLETRGAMINAEILYKLFHDEYTYTEVGVQHLPRKAGKATGAKPAVILRALGELFSYARKWHKQELEDALAKPTPKAALTKQSVTISHQQPTQKTASTRGSYPNAPVYTPAPLAGYQQPFPSTPGNYPNIPITGTPICFPQQYTPIPEYVPGTTQPTNR